MPKIEKVFTLEVSPERFLESCSDSELKELDLLIQSERYQRRIKTPINEIEVNEALVLSNENTTSNKQ